MLRNSADARRCSYFELALPVLRFVLNGRMFGTRQLKHDRITLRHRRQTNLRYASFLGKVTQLVVVIRLFNRSTFL